VFNHGWLEAWITPLGENFKLSVIHHICACKRSGQLPAPSVISPPSVHMGLLLVHVFTVLEKP